MAQKIAVWFSLLLLGGLTYITVQGSAYFSAKNETTLTHSSPIHLSLDCQFIGDPVDPLYTAASPRLDEGDGTTRGLEPYSSTVIQLSSIQVQAPPFVEVMIESVHVSDFSGLAPQRLSVRLLLTPDDEHAVQFGTWSLRLAAHGRLKEAYWAVQLRSPKAELARLEEAGTPPQIERAKKRVVVLESGSALMSRDLPISGIGVAVIESASTILGFSARWLSVLFGILGLILGGFTLLFLSMYIMTLKAGDMEP